MELLNSEQPKPEVATERLKNEHPPDYKMHYHKNFECKRTAGLAKKKEIQRFKIIKIYVFYVPLSFAGERLKNPVEPDFYQVSVFHLKKTVEFGLEGESRDFHNFQRSRGVNQTFPRTFLGFHRLGEILIFFFFILFFFCSFFFFFLKANGTLFSRTIIIT